MVSDRTPMNYLWLLCNSTRIRVIVHRGSSVRILPSLAHFYGFLLAFCFAMAAKPRPSNKAGRTKKPPPALQKKKQPKRRKRVQQSTPSIISTALQPSLQPSSSPSTSNATIGSTRKSRPQYADHTRSNSHGTAHSANAYNRYYSTYC